jgi:hypothetical protein
MVNTITVMNPVSPPRRLTNVLAVRDEHISGKRIGFLWNNKPNGDVIFKKIEKNLAKQSDITEFKYYGKWTASIPAETDVLEAMSQEVDLAIIGLAD